MLNILDFPNAVFDEFPLTSRKYCWMHGCANLLSNCCIDLLSVFPSQFPQRSTFIDIMQSIRPKWDPTTAFTPKQMKCFFQHQIQNQVIPLFNTPQTIYSLSWPTTPHTILLTTVQAVTMLFDSINIFYQFAYTEHPFP